MKMRNLSEIGTGVLLLAVVVMTGCTSTSYPSDRMRNSSMAENVASIPANTVYTVVGPTSGSHCESTWFGPFGMFGGRDSGVSRMRAFDQAIKAKNADWILDSVAERKVTVTSFYIFNTAEECVELRGLGIKFTNK